MRGIIIAIETRAGSGGAHDEGSTAAGDRLTKHVSNDNAVESAVGGLSIIDRVSTGRRAGEIGPVLPPLIREGRNSAGHAHVESRTARGHAVGRHRRAIVGRAHSPGHIGFRALAGIGHAGNVRRTDDGRFLGIIDRDAGRKFGARARARGAHVRRDLV